MNNPPEGPLWKRIGTLTLWIYLMPPVGLWKLYQDSVLSSTVKWRIAIYALVLPTLAYATLSIWMTNTALQRVMP